MEIDVNILAVVVAAVANFVVGMLWYSPMLFGKSWMKEIGMTESDMKKAQAKGMAKKMVIALISSFLMAYTLAWFLGLGAAADAGSAYVMTLWIWLGFFATALVDGVLWEGKSVKLWSINASYRLAGLLAMAVILVLWV